MFMTRDPRRFKTLPNQPSLGDKITHDGKVTSDPTTVQTCWTNHFKNLFRSQFGINSSIDEAQNEMPHLDALSRLNVDDIIDDDFTVEEVETCLKKLKCNKACGIDGLQPEPLKYGGSPVRSLCPSISSHWCDMSNLQGQGQRPSLLPQLQRNNFNLSSHEGL